MAEHDNNVDPETPDLREENILGEIVEETDEPEQPRRKASAQFVVDTEAGSQAAMREAMDPANQSLAEALRLSYRVLQIVILALVIAFLFSGIKTVEKGDTGVRTVFKRITGAEGAEALGDGFHFGWPYPIGEFVVFALRRTVDLGAAFWPNIDADKDFDEFARGAGVYQALHPGRDGSLLTRNGDIAHMRLTADYYVDDPVRYITNIKDRATADRIVMDNLQRAAIKAVATLTLGEFMEQRDEIIRLTRLECQRALDDLDCGIDLEEVTISRREPPAAIKKEVRRVTDARIEAQSAREKADQEASRILIEVAGSGHEQLAALIAEYEVHLEKREAAAAESVLAQINALLTGNETAGAVKDIVEQANSYQSEIESTLGRDARRVATLRPAYEENPELVIQQQWYQAYAQVVGQADVEIFSVPEGMGFLRVMLQGQDRIEQLRRKRDQDRRSMEAYGQGRFRSKDYLRGADYAVDRAGRTLTREGEGGQQGP